MDRQYVSMLVLIISTTISSSNKTTVWKLRAAYYYHHRPRKKERKKERKASNSKPTKILSSNDNPLNLYLDGIHGIIPYYHESSHRGRLRFLFHQNVSSKNSVIISEKFLMKLSVAAIGIQIAAVECEVRYSRITFNYLGESKRRQEWRRWLCDRKTPRRHEEVECLVELC